MTPRPASPDCTCHPAGSCGPRDLGRVAAAPGGHAGHLAGHLGISASEERLGSRGERLGTLTDWRRDPHGSPAAGPVCV